MKRRRWPHQLPSRSDWWTAFLMVALIAVILAAVSLLGIGLFHALVASEVS